jgi:hypothetical protein
MTTVRIVIVAGLAFVLVLAVSDSLVAHATKRSAPGPGHVEFQVCRVTPATHLAEAAGTVTGGAPFHLAFSDPAGDEEDVAVTGGSGRFHVSSTGRFPIGHLRCAVATAAPSGGM